MSLLSGVTAWHVLGHHSYKDCMSICRVEELDGAEVPLRRPSQEAFLPLGDLGGKRAWQHLAAAAAPWDEPHPGARTLLPEACSKERSKLLPL